MSSLTLPNSNYAEWQLQTGNVRYHLGIGVQSTGIMGNNTGWAGAVSAAPTIEPNGCQVGPTGVPFGRTFGQ